MKFTPVCISRKGEIQRTVNYQIALGKYTEPRTGGTYWHQCSQTVTMQKRVSNCVPVWLKKAKCLERECSLHSLNATFLGRQKPLDGSMNYRETLVWHPYILNYTKRLGYYNDRTMSSIMLAKKDFSVWWGNSRLLETKIREKSMNLIFFS